MLKKLTFSLILLASTAFAQTSVAPLDNPKMQFLSSAGVPLAGGKICSFAAGTTTPITTYSESTGTSANTNPITLDSGGFASIWVTSSAIKLIVYSSVGADSNCPNAGVSQYTVDGIAPAKPVAPMSLTAIADPAIALGNFWLSTTNVGRIKWSDAGAIRTVVATDTTDTLTNKTVVAGTFTGTETHSGQIQSTIATGTAPMSVTSTTPVANLTTAPTTYNGSGAQQTGYHFAADAVALSAGGTATATLSGAAAFSGTTTYQCFFTDVTGANAVTYTRTNSSTFVVTGTASHTIHFLCGGN